ncbi:MAG TPA: rRNA maturation RNase YbeY [Candidatus Sulfotelmatobacter sp.]|nr:rRNA maturation RNase YbeY [Candidatus Sulfotelmatobacter sp.]
MSGTLTLRNRQRTRALDLRLLRRIIRALLQDLLGREHFDLGFYFVGAPEMTRVNETFLQHAGSTDVITFDYNDPAQPEHLAGEIFVCVDEALLQARRFRTTWQSEVVRYVVHGVLHLSGYDDLQAQARRQMKRAENRLVKQLGRQFYLPKTALP